MTPAACRVLRFEAPDAEAVAAMVAAPNREEGRENRTVPPDAVGLRAAFLGADPAGALLVARAGGAAAGPAGYATGHATYETEFMARGFYMGDLDVAPGLRRRALTRGLRVRAARLEDAPAAAAAGLFNAINAIDGPPPPVWMTAEIVRRDLLGPSPCAALLVAESDGAVVGSVTGNTLCDSARAADCVFLSDLHVAPEARRRGAGRALVAALAAEARKRGAGCLWWGADLPDVEASRFYDALGAGDEGGSTGRILVGPAFDALADTAETG